MKGGYLFILFYIKNVGCIHIWKKAYPEKHQGSRDRWCNVRKAKNVGTV
jgi:hypothetical protein